MSNRCKEAILLQMERLTDQPARLITFQSAMPFWIPTQDVPIIRLRAVSLSRLRPNNCEMIANTELHSRWSLSARW